MKKFNNKFGFLGWAFVLFVLLMGAKMSDNFLRLGDKTGSDVQIQMGLGIMEWNNGLSKMRFSNNGGGLFEELGAGPLTTKGDLFSYDTGSQRLPVGADGQSLFADAAEAIGLKWLYGIATSAVSSGPATLTLDQETILFSAGANYTATLPTAVGNSGKPYTLKREDVTDAFTVTIEGAGAETLDGDLNKDLEMQYQSFRIISDGANWQILDRFIPFIAAGASLAANNQITTAGGAEQIVFDTERHDTTPQSVFFGGTFTSPYTGFYHADTNVRYQVTTAPDSVSVYFLKNSAGALLGYHHATEFTNTESYTANTAIDIKLSKGDTLEVTVVVAGAGGDISVRSSGSDDVSSFYVHSIGGFGD